MYWTDDDDADQEMVDIRPDVITWQSFESW